MAEVRQRVLLDDDGDCLYLVEGDTDAFLQINNPSDDEDRSTFVWLTPADAMELADKLVAWARWKRVKTDA